MLMDLVKETKNATQGEGHQKEGGCLLPNPFRRTKDYETQLEQREKATNKHNLELGTPGQI